MAEIRGRQRRTEDLDEHIAHYAAAIVTYLTPRKKGSRRTVKPDQLRRYRRLDEVPDEGFTVDEREDYITDHLARIGSPRISSPKVGKIA